jgi:hypothetical protein
MKEPRSTVAFVSESEFEKTVAAVDAFSLAIEQWKSTPEDKIAPRVKSKQAVK